MKESTIYCVWVMYENGEYQFIRAYTSQPPAALFADTENRVARRTNVEKHYWVTDEQLIDEQRDND